VTDDRQTTDHATENCVGIGGIACTREIPATDKANLGGGVEEVSVSHSVRMIGLQDDAV